MNLLKLFVYLFIMLFGIILFVSMQETIVDMDYTGWTFTGHEAIATLMPAMPMIFLVIFLSVPAYFIADELGVVGH